MLYSPLGSVINTLFPLPILHTPPLLQAFHALSHASVVEMGLLVFLLLQKHSWIFGYDFSSVPDGGGLMCSLVRSFLHLLFSVLLRMDAGFTLPDGWLR